LCDQCSQVAGAGLVDWSRPYANAALDEERVLTRLGDGKVSVRTPGLLSPLTGAPVEALPVPARWLAGIRPVADAAVSGAEVAIDALYMVYGEYGLVRR
jgi:hypothetical protein